METSLSFTGNIRGTPAKETVTFVDRHLREYCMGRDTE
jgi:hypothetical protein